MEESTGMTENVSLGERIAQLSGLLFDAGMTYLPSIVGAVLLLMLVEIVNSAIEAVVDRVSTDRHPLSGYAKDLGSAAVFFALLLLFSTWMLVLWDRVA